MTRCLNGRNVAYIRSKEITAIFVTEAKSKNVRTRFVKIYTVISTNMLQGKKGNIGTPKITPTNMSTTVKFITKHVLLLRRFLFLIKTMIVRRLTDTMITDSVTNTANQAIHSDVIYILNSVVVFSLFVFRISLLLVNTCWKLRRKKSIPINLNA